MIGTGFVVVLGAGVGWSGAGLPAQGEVLPPSHATRAGSGATQIPFGRPGPVRLQAAYDPLCFATPTRTVTRLELRVDEGQSARGKRVELELRLSTMPGGVERLQSAFALNRGVDETVAISRRTVDLPAVAAAPGPTPFRVGLGLDRSFAYDSAAGSLLVELVVSGQAPGGYPLDATWLCDSVRTAYGPPACGPAGGPVLGAETVTTRATWGQNLVLRVFDAPPDAPVGVFLGVLERGVWNGVSIPFDLTALGAPGCHLSIDVLAAVVARADGAGAAHFSTFVPSRPELRGSFVRFQGFAIDPQANHLGVTTSQPYEIEICGWEAVARLFAAGLDAPTGLRELGVAPVVRLR